MSIQAIRPWAPPSAGKASKPAETRSGPHESGTTPTDRVMVSEEARAMSAQSTAQGLPELQLSPARLRALMEQTVSAGEAAEPSE